MLSGQENITTVVIKKGRRGGCRKSNCASIRLPKSKEGEKKIKKTASVFRTRTPAIKNLSCQGVSCNLNYIQWYYFPISTDTVTSLKK